MVTRAGFQEMVNSAYQSLYDFVELRNHPLTQLLVGDDTATKHKERGWQTHHMLLEAVEELYPGPDAPPFSREWRRHRLMVLRYVEAMEPQAVAGQLAISRRQFYREHAAALEAIAAILWERCDPPDSVAEPATTNRADAMQAELVRISQSDTFADLSEVIEGALAVLDRVLLHNEIAVEVALPDEIPLTAIGHNLLRQVILGLLGALAETVQETTIRLSVSVDNSATHLQIKTVPPQPLDEFQVGPQLAALQSMLHLGSARLSLLPDDRQRPIGFELKLPAEYDCTVLAVDDNEDTLALYKRWLTPNRYRVITTDSVQPVLDLAREVRPDIIILDLMMPEQDGWDLLQLLANQPHTAHIPIMICSVLKQKQLALLLGASVFLEKPFTEQALLDALEEVRC